MNILAIGDIFGRPGRAALKALLPGLIKKYSPDFVVANIENAAGGRGVTQKVAEELSVCPVDIFTSGNHIWDHKTFLPFLDRYSILRPANVKGDLPGFGFGIYPSKNNKRIGVINLQGRVFMEGKGPELDNPFDVCEKILSDMKSRTDCILIDFHAETTSEKKSFGHYFDGKVSAIWGTHTHVQTADEAVLPGGTAYISDLGMTGPHLSVIGVQKEIAIERIKNGNKAKFKVAEEGVRLEGVLIEINENTKKAKSIQRLQVPYEYYPE